MRNIKPGFKRGLWFGLINAALETVTVGHAPWTLHNSSNWRSRGLDSYAAPERDWVHA